MVDRMASLLLRYSARVSTPPWYARKDCPAYIRPHWSAFLAAVRQYLGDDTQVPSDYDKLVEDLSDLKEQLQLQHTNAQDFRDEILAVVAKYETK